MFEARSLSCVKVLRLDLRDEVRYIDFFFNCQWPCNEEVETGMAHTFQACSIQHTA